MKIDIGADGKILGTKRVSANGQISGFTEYAGAEVLVILPGGELPIVRRDARDVLDEMEKIVEEDAICGTDLFISRWYICLVNSAS